MLRIILLSAGLSGSFFSAVVLAEASGATGQMAGTDAAGADTTAPAPLIVANNSAAAVPADSRPSAERRPEARAKPDVWQRIREADRIPVEDKPAVAAYRERYTREARWISKTLRRGVAVLGHLIDALDARDMPLELALLPAVESSFEPSAMSKRKASGLWQIIPVTAAEMGLGRTDWFDGRGDLVNSTEAALDYLSALNAQFDGDWLLTLAAYNAGPGRVSRAIQYNLDHDRPTDFWSLPLPRETRNYVPKLISLLQLIEAQGTDQPIPGLYLRGVPAHPAFTQVDAGRRISIDRAASLAGLPERELRFLNAGWIHGITSPEGPHTLYLPTASVDQFVQALADSDKRRLASLPDTHTVAAGESLGAIAERYDTTTEKLQALNRLHGDAIRTGQKLVIALPAPAPVEVNYVVTSGDSLSAIAERYSVELDAITTASGELPASDIIHPGQRLKIAVPSSSQVADAEQAIN